MFIPCQGSHVAGLKSLYTAQIKLPEYNFVKQYTCLLFSYWSLSYRHTVGLIESTLIPSPSVLFHFATVPCEFHVFLTSPAPTHLSPLGAARMCLGVALWSPGSFLGADSWRNFCLSQKPSVAYGSSGKWSFVTLCAHTTPHVWVYLGHAVGVL